ncbi:phosphoribosyltransferase [Geothrix sp. PMB-07]|uniref:phosphoribosyltransferase n=1 Tax=Geothrix sp. PMB-07 TaxID=3068640 RepID=UPI00274168E0|nr:phosphoribosyltransferase [Geothrix sp. PMB-07]WLT32966.1 phosphoribosyltransferase [Geothrix sp. PMB-07]
MLHRLIYSDWDHPPECMAFEAPYEEVLTQIQNLLPGILARKDEALASPATLPSGYWEDCVRLYLLTPALVNIALNFKVCVEQGLPLHPTYYFEITEATRFQAKYPERMVHHTNAFFLESIEVARALYGLEADAVARLDQFVRDLPEVVAGFIYTSTKDKYTWRASNPAKIVDLADHIRKRVSPTLIVGAAHGSILSGLVLANLLKTPLYFIRFSMFKRNDPAPVIAPSDRSFLEAYQAGPVLLFDEDVAKGTTLTKFTETLQPYFRESYTASVLRHALSPCAPDFVGRAWHD